MYRGRKDKRADISPVWSMTHYGSNTARETHRERKRHTQKDTQKKAQRLTEKSTKTAIVFPQGYSDLLSAVTIPNI